MADNSTVSYPMGRLFTGVPTVDMPNRDAVATTIKMRVAQREGPQREGPEIQTPTAVEKMPNLAGRRVCGEYDGYVKIIFSAGKSYDHVFAFDLPNVIGNLGVAGINDAAITEMIERALVDKLGRGGVVRHKPDHK